jgi:3-isopropylmalate/(R)-2-methylmalate dehydratase small subunit
MEKFTTVTGIAAPLLMTNINTDLIAPSLMPGRTPEEAATMPLKEKMFANLRFNADGSPKPDFPLDQSRHRNARVLLAGPNFGCGSSRETAVWALLESGIRCVIAPSFGDIFHDNAYQNGLLPLRVEMPVIERIAVALDRSNTSEMTIDLERRQLLVPGLEPIPFNIPDDRRRPLLEGLDQLGMMLLSQDDIADFEARDAAARPWAYPAVAGAG